MIAPAFPINEKIQDDSIDGSCDTTGNQQDEEGLIRIPKRSVIPASGIYYGNTLTTYCYVRSALQAYMPATPYEK